MCERRADRLSSVGPGSDQGRTGVGLVRPTSDRGRTGVGPVRPTSDWPAIIRALVSLTPGVRLGPYEIVAAIGAGGMGEVYRARDTALGRDVAVKVLPDSLLRD